MPNMLGGAATPKKEEALTVAQLTELLREHIETRFFDVAVEGEISNWTAAGSGHCYFSLKDAGALISCVLWKGSRTRLRFKPEEGAKVVCRGRVSLYPPRGQYQLVVESMSLAGMGELWQRFQDLKERLGAEGLFEPTRKRALPRFPRTVGIVTSPTGAAIRDMLSVLGRRAPGVSVILHPAKVQGDGAAAEITRGVERLGASGLCDVLIVGRGGGSFEDLFEFNDERLARVIAACPVPVVSAVGHEVDFSICDFVADLRAPTPSAGAEIVSAGYVDVERRLREALARMSRELIGRVQELRARLDGLTGSHALRRPELLLREYQQRADLAVRRLPELVDRRLRDASTRVGRLVGSLEGHNPELILRKGYAILRRAGSGRVLMSSADLRRNMQVDVQLRDGLRRAVVTDDEADDLFA